MLYLDANSHIPMHPKALDIFYNYEKSNYGNAMSSSILGKKVSFEIENTRTKISNIIGANKEQIIFTSTGTQACEFALKILKSRNYSKVYSSTIEHPSVSKKAIELFGNNDLLVSKDGIVACTANLEHNSAYICIHVQNEIGTIQKIENIPVPFFTDISQSIGKIPINLNKCKNLKLAAFGSHKFGGPASIGVLYLQDPNWWIECDYGSRYNHDRAGTPDVASILACGVALEEANKTINTRYENALRFRTVLENGLKDLGIKIIAETANRIPYTTFAYIGNKNGAYIQSQLEESEIYIGLGSACGSLSKRASSIMTALGNGGSVQDYIRISQWGEYGEREANQVILAIKKCLPKS